MIQTGNADRARLLEIARRAIEAHVSPPSREALRRGLAEARRWTGGRAEAGPQSPIGSRQSAVGSPQSETEAFAGRRAGVFVTIYHAGELRGCIGHIEADQPLPVGVARCAVAACCEDPRFPAVSASELRQIQLEISVLGPLEPLAGSADVEIGRHGLMVEMGRLRGLLLPQVATERQWNAVMFLSQTCRKAGLAPDVWRHGATVWRFEAEVFGDDGAH
jgi:AmmeMemoRadiSam system protein A